MFRFAIIGCGRMGQHHTQALQAAGRGRVVALFDVDRGTAEGLHDELAAEADVYDDLESLLDNVALDAVIPPSHLLGDPARNRQRHFAIALASGSGLKFGDTLLEVSAAVAPKVGCICACSETTCEQAGRRQGA